jgi:hypothetical protein
MKNANLDEVLETCILYFYIIEYHDVMIGLWVRRIPITE